MKVQKRVQQPDNAISNTGRRTLLLSAAAGGVALSMGNIAWANTWPVREIRMVIPFSAGGGTDTNARWFAEALSKELKQPVVVENKPGANGIIGVQTALQAPADGYTVLLTGLTTHAANPVTMKSIPYDPANDFTYISMVVKAPMALVVPANHPANTVHELVESLKSKSSVNFGSAHFATRVAGELFSRENGLNATDIPYKGTAQGITDLLGGLLDFMFPDVTTALPFLQGERLKALAITSDQRMASLPNLPTMIESGFKDFEVTTWSTLMVAGKAPDDVIKVLNKATINVLSRPEAAAFMESTGGIVTHSTPEEAADFVKAEQQRAAKIAKLAGITPQ